MTAVPAGTRGRVARRSRRDGDEDEVVGGTHEDLEDLVGDADDDEVGHEREGLVGDPVDAGSSLEVRHVGGSTGYGKGSGKRTKKRRHVQVDAMTNQD